ncbi:hypothetical protein BDQ12DRAFT_712464 [Crucibulum laeve]|uniref:DUF6534 domain-containing protein n=1 Tax=Crucibulum laeve TaxID=68775 RepID=A0A5C3M299_9AGAR|nr:hypothetical protein BDQ12DRAFT_712464 [Crucibulum laeve]
MSSHDSISFDNPIILDLTSTQGALLIGCFFSCIVWGMSCLQMFYYYFHYPSDSAALKGFVFFVWVADTVNEILILKSMWPTLIAQWGSVTGLSVVPIGMVHHIWLSGVVAICVQFFYLYRMYIWRFSTLSIHCLHSCLRNSVSSSTNNLLDARMSPLTREVHFSKTDFSFANIVGHRLVSLNISMRACSTGVDIFIAVMMSYYILSKGTPHFSNTRKMYFRLFILTINTGAWTAIFAAMDFILMIVYPDALYYTIFEWPLCSLYLSVLLSNLNARKFVRGDGDTHLNLSLSIAERTAPRSRGSHEIVSGKPTTSYHHTKDSVMMVNIETSKIVDAEIQSDFKHPNHSSSLV